MQIFKCILEMVMCLATRIVHWDDYIISATAIGPALRKSLKVLGFLLKELNSKLPHE
jgi:hypothetical protein